MLHTQPLARLLRKELAQRLAGHLAQVARGRIERVGCDRVQQDDKAAEQGWIGGDGIDLDEDRRRRDEHLSPDQA